ncbi:type II toxin-antitoxin system RelE/ParE family toxin [Candidatus Microgenomates bacterium]|nr:type II toxin-antitoxin system RelE/ParE family toxin [Candidatus Microgenomates bacterium]
MYRIIISPEAKNQLKQIKQIHQNALASIVETLKQDPYLGKPLGRELLGKYSYRIGVFRIIYKINKKDNVINIITAGHRSNVYN